MRLLRPALALIPFLAAMLSLGCSADPELNLSQESLDYGSSDDVRSLVLTNTGDKTLDWHAAEVIEWFSLTPQTSGSLNSGQSITLSGNINRSSLLPGEHADYLSISGNFPGSPLDIAVVCTKACDLAFNLTPSNISSGSVANIRWTPDNLGSLTLVTLELMKGSTVVGTISSSTPADGLFEWTCTDFGHGAGSDYRFRLAFKSFPQCFVMSNAFSITVPCSFTFTAPTSFASWPEGSARSIAWTSTSAPSNIDLTLLRSGVFQCQIATNVPNSGSYNWSVTRCTGDPSPYYSIKITSRGDPSCYKVSPQFTIPDPTGECDVTVSAPLDGTSWAVGSVMNVAWTSQFTSGSLQVQLYKSGTRICFLDDTVGPNGSLNWTVSPCSFAPGPLFKVMVSDKAAPNTCYGFSGYFTITLPTVCSISDVTVLGPVEEGSTEQISWASSGTSGNVKLELYRNSLKICNLATTAPDNGSYYWLVNDCSAGEGWLYQVKISDLANPSCSDFSDYFSIQTEPPCSITISEPHNGEELLEGQVKSIQWNSTSASSKVDIALLYSTSSCQIANDVPNVGAHAWTVAPCPGFGYGSVRIRVQDAYSNTCLGVSDYFTLRSDDCEITVTSPPAGAVWTEGQTQNIDWTSSSADPVWIDLYEGSSYVCRISDPVSDGDYSWSVDDCGNGPDNDYRIKLTSELNTDCTTYSGYFTIAQPELHVNSAVLTFEVSQVIGGTNLIPHGIFLLRKAGNWEEGETGCSTGFFPDPVLDYGSGTFTLAYDVPVSVIEDWYNSVVQPNTGFVLFGNPENTDADGLFVLRSDESSVPDSRPNLSILYRFGSGSGRSVDLRPTDDAYWDHADSTPICRDEPYLKVGIQSGERKNTYIKFRIDSTTLTQ